MTINFQELNQNEQATLLNLNYNLKLQSDNIKNKLLKYKELNKAKIRYMMIQNYKNSLKPLKELKELELLRKQ